MDAEPKEPWESTRQQKKAAVLIPIIEREQKTILLTQRTEHLTHHPGQVSFPGGRAEGVDNSPADTALRETFEEVGIPASLIDVCGMMEPFKTVTDFHVTPVVGFVHPRFTLKLDQHEVESAFEVPLDLLLDQSNYQRKEIFWQGENRFYWEVMFEGYQIWGATAAMLYAYANLVDQRTSQLKGNPLI